MSDSTERYQLPEQLRMAAGAVRDYVRNEIVPLEQQIPHDSIHLPKDEYDRLVPVAKNMGMWCTGVATEFGGGGLSLFSQVVIDEEMVQHAAGLYCPVYGTMGEPPPEIIFAGNDYLRDTYGIPTVQGQRKAWFAITEPSGGSRPRPCHPDPSRPRRRRLGHQRKQGLHIRRTVGRLGHRVRPHQPRDPTRRHCFRRRELVARLRFDSDTRHPRLHTSPAILPGLASS